MTDFLVILGLVFVVMLSIALVVAGAQNKELGNYANADSVEIQT